MSRRCAAESDKPPTASPPSSPPGRDITLDDGSTAISGSAFDAVDDTVENVDADEAGTQLGGTSSSSNGAGLAIGILLAVLAAGACTAAVLYRRKRRGRKSTYITFGNPSYSREHLPANDFSLDSPLTLSSNGYTVLA